MAIEKMKKLRLIAVREQKDELLKDLMLMGCVEVSEPENMELSEQLSSFIGRENGGSSHYRAQQSVLVQSIEVLNKYAPEKGKLLSAKPETDIETLLDDSETEKVYGIAEEICESDDRIKRATSEESRIRGTIESLAPWLSLELPLECEGTSSCTAVKGGIPAAIELNEVVGELAKASELSELVEVSRDKDQHYLVLVCINEQLQQALDCVRNYGFTIANFSGMSGTAAENTARLHEELAALAEEKAGLTKKIEALAENRQEIKLCADRIAPKLACAEAEDKLCGMKSVVALQGWALERMVPELEKCLENYACAWELEDPVEEEYEKVPVKLRSNKVTNALNMVTNMYSLPAYGGIDPNPLIAPFFILFYGLMMADMGYGLIMIIAAVVAMKKIKPKDGTLSFCQLLLYSGISTFIVGAITGGFFGDALEQIGRILNLGDGWGKLPSLFNPMQDSMMVLIGAMCLGVIQLNAGLLISFVHKVKKGNVLDAVFYEGSLWVVLAGLILFALKIGNVAGVPVVLIIGLVMLFYGGMRGKKGAAIFTSLFSTLYNEATGWFGDILSYARIMALMLAGSVIATVFNTIGAIANNIFVFALIFVIGHTLNFGLNLLGCYVHDLRLQCLEYFGKFYEDGGKPFAPLAVKTKYYNVAEE